MDYKSHPPTDPARARLPEDDVAPKVTFVPFSNQLPPASLTLGIGGGGPFPPGRGSTQKQRGLGGIWRSLFHHPHPPVQGDGGRGQSDLLEDGVEALLPPQRGELLEADALLLLEALQQRLAVRPQPRPAGPRSPPGPHGPPGTRSSRPEEKTPAGGGSLRVRARKTWRVTAPKETRSLLARSLVGTL